MSDSLDKIASVFSLLDPPLWVVTSASKEQQGGLVATFVSTASICPEAPRVLAGLGKRHHTWGLVEESGVFGLHLLGPDQREWVERFGLDSGHHRNKFAGLEVGTGATGCPLLLQSPGRLECRVEAKLDSGDRTIYLAAVVAGSIESSFQPLTMATVAPHLPTETLVRLRENLKTDAALDFDAIRNWRKLTLDFTLP